MENGSVLGSKPGPSSAWVWPHGTNQKLEVGKSWEWGCEHSWKQKLRWQYLHGLINPSVLRKILVKLRLVLMM